MKLLSAILLFTSMFGAELKLGKPLQLKRPVSIAELNAKPDEYVDKTVQVKGKVTEVCQMMGCWMALSDPASNQLIRIEVEDGEMVFPKDAAGKMAIAEGKLTKTTLTKEQATARARHEAEEQKRTFDPESVKGPAVIYQIHGSGAVLLD